MTFTRGLKSVFGVHDSGFLTAAWFQISRLNGIEFVVTGHAVRHTVEMEADALKDESADLLGSDTEEPEKEPRSLGIAPSELHRIPSENSGKKSFYIYDQRSDGVFKQIVKVIAFQRAIGISAVFDPEGIKAGFKNISWFIISTESPAMTYVIDCYRVDLHEVFLDLRRILQNPLVLKIVYGVKETLGYLYQVQHVRTKKVYEYRV